MFGDPDIFFSKILPKWKMVNWRLWRKAVGSLVTEHVLQLDYDSRQVFFFFGRRSKHEKMSSGNDFPSSGN